MTVTTATTVGGTLAASVAVQRAFDAYRGDKMNHEPVTLVRLAQGAAWIRLDGFASADDLLSEIHGSHPADGAH